MEDDLDSLSSNDKLSRPVSPGAASAAAARKPSRAAVKPKKGRVVIQDDSGADSADAAALGAQRQVADLQQQLREANEEVAKRARAQLVLEQQLKESTEKHAALMRSGAKRLLQIAALERERDSERSRGKRMMDELVKQTQMMDLVINFRDQECARDVNELTQENMELSDKLDVWRERAEMLQSERWGFVQKVRGAKANGSGADAGTADAVGAGAVDEDDESDGGDEDDDGSDNEW